MQFEGEVQPCSDIWHITAPEKPSLGQRIAALPRPHSNDNPLWQGPCGEGWNGGVTQSMLGRFFCCRERFRLKYILGLDAHDRWSHRMGYGTMWHVCEEALAADVDPLLKLRMHALDQCQRYPMQREEIAKWANVCGVQFPEYVKYWAEHPDVKNKTSLLQEQVFDVPYALPSGRTVRLRGKWDSVDLVREETEGMLGRHRQVTEGIWLQENKTKGEVDKLQIERQLKFDLQTMLYLIALETECREDAQDSEVAFKCHSHPILGVRYNVVRRPLSGGKGSIRPHEAKSNKAKGTHTPAETAEHFYERLRADYIAKEPEYWFFRVRAEVSAEDVRVFRDTCLDPLLEHLCDWYDGVTRFQSYNGVRNGYMTPMNYRTPFGIYNSIAEDGATEYDHFLETGSDATLRRVTELFTELK